MTASPPAAPDFCAENAKNSAEHHADSAYCSGMPSEEEIARALLHAECEPDKDETGYGEIWGWEDIMPPVRHRLIAQARAILDLIRPAFEAKEREARVALIKQRNAEAKYDDVFEKYLFQEERALAAEAKLAKAVEALEPFADAANSYDPDEGDGAQVAWSHDFTIASLRRARSASAAARPHDTRE